jgi:hypothetical protein
VKAVRRRFHFDILMLLIIVNHPLADLVPLILYNFAVVSVNNRYQFSVLGYMAKYGPNLFAAWQNSDDLLIAWQNRDLPLICSSTIQS